MQVADALKAFHAELGCAYLALIGQLKPPQWQSGIIATRFPALQAAGIPVISEHVSDPGHTKPSHSIVEVTQAAAALHGLPVSWQPASADAFSCVQSLASTVELLTALVPSPAVMRYVKSDSMGILVAALRKQVPWGVGPSSEKVQALLGVIRGHDEALVQRIEQEGYQEQHSCLLGLLRDWTVRVGRLLHISGLMWVVWETASVKVLSGKGVYTLKALLLLAAAVAEDHRCLKSFCRSSSLNQLSMC